jgi:hypothetical protein
MSERMLKAQVIQVPTVPTSKDTTATNLNPKPSNCYCMRARPAQYGILYASIVYTVYHTVVCCLLLRTRPAQYGEKSNE